jgi:TRAP-type C4-dicarboxylate transport system permease small subunit
VTGLLRRAVELWALAGGIVLLGVALMTSWSAASGWVFSRPLPGDVELTEMLVAVAAFAFLPYCQLTRANVSADIFTARAGPRTVALLALLSALIALGFSLLLTWRMYEGLLDYRKYVETTTILRIPIWYAYLPALASLVLLALACLASVREAVRDWAGRR